MKYKLKEPPAEEMQTYKEICIRCGKTQLVSWPKALPIPSMTEYIGKPSWFSCNILKEHFYYPENRLVINNE